MKAAIPVVHTGNHELDRFCETMKQNMDGITGQHQNSVKLKPLTSSATTAEIVAQLNDILTRIQG